MVKNNTLAYSAAPVPNVRTERKLMISRELKITTWIMIAHIPLGVLLYNAGSFAVVHPLAILVLGLYWATQKRYSLSTVAIAAGYIIGGEVLWRMAHVPIYWEFGKYGSIFIMVVALFARRKTKIPKLPLIYFFALIPSCLLTLTNLYPEDPRDKLSFNMSGPLFLAVSCWFFSHVRTNVPQVRRILLAVVAPLLSVACVTLFYTVTSENIEFNAESNFATSGGYGPNQVSGVLGLGLFLTLTCLVLFRNTNLCKAVFGALAVFFAAQSMLTFSRGGIYAAIGAGIVLIMFNFRNTADGMKRLLPILVLVGLFAWFVFPFLNDFTGGKLIERFEDEGTTKRVDIIESDITMFLQNPLLGVGPGISIENRKRYLQYRAATHTEFSRMLSEHGLGGLLALTCLIVMTILNVLRRRSIFGRALVAGVSVWAIMFMFNTGMRLAAPAFIWGMSFITVVNGRRVRSEPGHLDLPSRRLADPVTNS